MNKIINKIMDIFEKLSPYLIKFSQLKYIQILQSAFVVTMPVLLIGSTFLLVAAFPVPAVKDFLAPLNLGSVSTVTLDMFSLYLVVAVSYYTAQYNETKKGITLNKLVIVIMALSGFFLTIKPMWGDMLVAEEALESVGNYIPMAYVGTKGILASMVIGAVTAEIFTFFISRKITIKMPDGVPPMVVQSFASIIPYFAIMIFWWFFAIFLGLNIPQIFLDLFKPLVSAGDSLPVAVGLTFLNRALWMVGIHGSNVVAGVTGPILTTMATANLEAGMAGLDFPYIATTYFYDVYVWLGFVPLSLVLILSKSPTLKKLGWLSLAPAIFNIGEPLIFGIPIVLNPILLVPFIFSYVFLAIFGYLGIAFGILPQPYLSVMWTMPAPIKAFLSTNYSFVAVIYVLLGWLFIFLMFYPFIKVIEKQKEEKKEAKELKEAQTEEDEDVVTE